MQDGQCRGVGSPGAGGDIMLPQVLTDMSRMSCSAATKVPELWAKVGGGRSRVAGSGRQMGPIVPSSVGGVAWAPGLSAGGRGVAVAASHNRNRVVATGYNLLHGRIARSVRPNLYGQRNVLIHIVPVSQPPFCTKSPSVCAPTVRQSRGVVPPTRNGQHRALGKGRHHARNGIRTFTPQTAIL